MSVNWWQSEICIVINNKSLGNTAKHLSLDGYFIANLSLDLLMKDFLNQRTFGEDTGNMVDCVICPICLRLLSSKM